ncbi:SLBB domain-containing protein [Methylophilus aquaticus]|uniref:SLBB domain-containing protein n=1 Tax=Methylophilus aquaticus TaxID=1971610 RepID=A0ABT9JUJ5_9PROT|nr:SLBB domain-containing protein [Methylophilus aquaticus]MDP8567775.1 SLBB domain-containing protein [Methylophilus aquaticus]
MIFFKRFLLLFFVLLPVTAFADYTLGTGDYVKVIVYGDPELTREVRVAENGILSFPLIGEVQVNGLTSVQTERRIAEELKRGGFIASPQVSVVVLQFLSKTVSILGGVMKPGRYPVTRASDIKDMIAEAGGFTPDASEIVTVVTGDKRTEYDLREIIQQQVKSDDLAVTGGETIYVGMRDVAVVGQFLRPGKYGIQGGTRKIADFLSLAGGVNENAAEEVYYTTSVSGSPVTEKLNIDELFKGVSSEKNKMVYPGDVLYVPKAPQLYIYGEVQRPGMYKIDKNMTVMQAIAKASGLTVRGTQRSVKLYRKNAQGEVEKQSPNLTTDVRDEDVLFIEESLL